MAIQSPSNLYIPGLNGIRAIAAGLVIISHVDQMQDLFNNTSDGYYKGGIAGQAVNMFFVLSGFLITYLLLMEKEKHGHIHIKNFYLRRILRIWPLYYFAVLVSVYFIYAGIIDYPSQPKGSILLYLFFMPNVAFALHISITAVTHLWSVGVEEQFYLIWPIIIRKLKKPLAFFMMFIGFYLLLKLSIYLIFYKSFLYSLINYTRIDIMAFGAIGAVLIHEKRKILNVIFHPIVQLISWGVLIYSIGFHIFQISSLLDNELNSIFSLVIILNVGFNPASYIKLENKLFNYFGKISYGLYVYHIIIIYAIGYLCEEYSYSLYKPFTYLSVSVLTIIIAHYSYFYLESPILKLKKKFIAVPAADSKIKSDLSVQA